MLPDFPKPGIVFKDITADLERRPRFSKHPSMSFSSAVAGRKSTRSSESMRADSFFWLSSRLRTWGRLRSDPQARENCLTKRRQRNIRWSMAKRKCRCTSMQFRPGEQIVLVDDLLANRWNFGRGPRYFIAKDRWASFSKPQFLIELEFSAWPPKAGAYHRWVSFLKY